MSSSIEIKEGGFLKIGGNASINIGGVEINPKTIKEGYLPIHGDFMTGELNIEPKVWLTKDQATNLLAFISIFHCANEGKPLAQDKELKALWSMVYDQLKRIEQAERCDA